VRNKRVPRNRRAKRRVFKNNDDNPLSIAVAKGPYASQALLLAMRFAGKLFSETER